MVAPGAMACEYWVSSAISPAQSTWSALLRENVGQAPVVVAEATQMILRLAAGRPNVESNSARSLAMYGSPKASMMTIVLPLPVRLRGTSYAVRIWDGP